MSNQDEHLAAEALQLAARWHRHGVADGDILDTLAGVAISGSINHRGAVVTAAWLRSLADAIEATAPVNNRH